MTNSLTRVTPVQLPVRQAGAQLLALVTQLYQAGLRELDAYRGVEELADARQKVLAIQTYISHLLGERASRLKAQNLLAEPRLRQERAIGVWVSRHVDHCGGGDRRPRSHRGTVIGDLPAGVTKNDSSRFQRIAAIPEAVFEHYLITTRDAQKELTTAGVLRLAREVLRPSQADLGATPSCTVDDLQKLVHKQLRFGTIYADPPWPYENRATRAAAADHYPTMSLDELAALPVGDLADRDCHLHLWTTNAFLFECTRHLRAWGFDYRSMFVWAKPTVGLGNWWRLAHEFLLLGTRGRRPFLDRSQRSWQCLERGTHSAKPEAIRRLIEKVSPGPRLELFGRKAVDGWVVWGNQIERGLFDEHIGRM